MQEADYKNALKYPCNTKTVWREFRIAHRRASLSTLPDRLDFARLIRSIMIGMSRCIQFGEVARLPEPGDNAAIGLRRLDSGCSLALGTVECPIVSTIPEGHRLAVRSISEGELLLSWGLPFGRALKAIRPGEYLSNARMLEALRERHVPFGLPAEPNFENYRAPFRLDENAFQPGQQIPTSNEARTFNGFLREPGRGVGTRNHIVILGTTSRTASFARLFAERFSDVSKHFPNIDGVVPIAHTEGGGTERPNNFDLLIRTLAGFLTNPNVAAFMAIDFGNEVFTNAMLQSYLESNSYPFRQMPHVFTTLRDSFEVELKKHEQTVRNWLPVADGIQRSARPLRDLKIGLQCGGSDAFSGVSANPVLGIMSRELVRHGGAANLAETDELIGAESYVLANVRNIETARAFLRKIEEFQARASWHGHTAEGNPSGGNLFRGLYNISIKSIGAARKKDPSIRLDHVIDYSERMQQPGFYFMDSPGNDLESIAGQVAAGCNLILFATGNGSITNFPFVPTVKVMTTTARFNLLSHEMDFNAGRYLDGESLESLGLEAFEQMISVASGASTAGDRAGHSQVQIWREWRQTGPVAIPNVTRVFDGLPLQIERPYPELLSTETLSLFRTSRGFARERIGLIMPTSLCAGEIAKIIAQRLNADTEVRSLSGVSRYVALAHTEGCGNSAGVGEEILLRTMTSHLRHPSVRRALLLEHGCEKTHNDAMRNFIEASGAKPDDFGWASVQLDGGIDRVANKVIDYFKNTDRPVEQKETTGIEHLQIGFLSDGNLPENVAGVFSRLITRIVAKNGTVVLPENSMDRLSALQEMLQSQSKRITIDFAQIWREPGLHVMHTPTKHVSEIITGLAAAGVELVVAFASHAPIQSHPIVPVLQIGRSEERLWEGDLDLTIAASASETEIDRTLWPLLLKVYSGFATPKLFAGGNTNFQVTRGLWGVSL